MGVFYGSSAVGTSGINGDTFFTSPDKSTMMLSDGASGAGDEGKVVMSNYCAKIIRESPFLNSGLSADEYFDKIIYRINNGLIKISQECKTYTFGTLVICLLQGDTAAVASIGDSPAYHIHGQTVKRVAKTKRTFSNLIERGILTEEQAENSIKQLPVHMWSMFDRFIPMVVPVYAVEEVELASGDMIVLCSDGVSDYVNPDEIKDMLMAEEIPAGISRIIDTAKERSVREWGKIFYDDITMVVYRHG